MHVHIEVDDARALVAAGRPRRGGERYFSDRRPAPDLDSVAALLPRAEDGGGGLHRRRRDATSATRRSPAPRSPRAPHATTTCSSRSARSTRHRRGRRRPGPAPGRGPRRARASSSTRPCRDSTRATRRTTRCTRRSRMPASRRSSTPARPASARDCPAAAACGSGCRTRCCSTPSRPTSPTCRSSWPTRRCRGRTRRSSVATHKHNTWIDLSGWSPKYFPAELVRYANSLLKDRVLFGSDFPLLTPDRWLRDAEQTALKPEVDARDPEAQRRPAARPGLTDHHQRSTHDHHRRLRRRRRTRRHRPRLHRLARDHAGPREPLRRRHRRPPVDPRRPRARGSPAPSAAPIAHGFLTLSLAIKFWTELLDVEGVTTKVNYGLDKVRFISPVKVGARVRMTRRHRRGRRGRRRLPAHRRPDDRDRRRHEARRRRARALPLLRLRPASAGTRESQRRGTRCTTTDSAPGWPSGG